MTHAQTAVSISPIAVACLVLALFVTASTHAADPAHTEPAKKPVAAAPAPAASAASAKATAPSAPMTPKEIGNQVREAVEIGAASKTMTLMVNGKDKKYITIPAVPKKETAHSDGSHSPAVAVAIPAAPAAPGRIVNPVDSRQYIRAKAAALAGHGTAAAAAMSGGHGAAETHWTYEGATGPQAWGTMKPEFNVCAIGKRQSPINIEDVKKVTVETYRSARKNHGSAEAHWNPDSREIADHSIPYAESLSVETGYQAPEFLPHGQS